MFVRRVWRHTDTCVLPVQNKRFSLTRFWCRVAAKADRSVLVLERAAKHRRASMEMQRQEGTCLLQALRQRVHHHLGYGGFTEYTDRGRHGPTDS